ncbi:MAG: DUF4214 domain-containing protein [Acidithiobacillus sp.]
MQVQHVTELFSFEGEDFIAEVFRNLLGREPDAFGLRYYLGRLALGYDKSNVIAQIAKSSECRPHEEFLGLKTLLVEQQRGTHWFWGRWKRYSRTTRSWQSGFARISAIGQQLTDQLKGLHSIDHQLAVQQDALLSLSQNMSSMSVKITGSLQQLSASPAISVPTYSQARNISDEAVRQAFRDVLGREPEGDDTIAYHARLANVQVLREALVTSEEFKMRIDPMPEYARFIFRRMLIQQSFHPGD